MRGCMGGAYFRVRHLPFRAFLSSGEVRTILRRMSIRLPRAIDLYVKAENSGDVEALSGALDQAIRCRNDLPGMGLRARTEVEQYAGPGRVQELADWFYNGVSEQCPG